MNKHFPHGPSSLLGFKIKTPIFLLRVNQFSPWMQFVVSIP